MNNGTGVRRSEQINEFATALAKAQGEYEAVEKKREAVVQGRTKDGREYNYRFKYADLGDVLSVALPILSKHEIAFTQPTVVESGVIYVRTTLIHSSGQWQESDYPVCSFGDKRHQQMGEALTFAKRYAGCAALGIAPEETIEGDDVGGDVEVGAPQRSAPLRQEPPAVVQSGQRELPPVVGMSPGGPQGPPTERPVKVFSVLRPTGQAREFPFTKEGAIEALGDLEAQCAMSDEAWELNKSLVVDILAKSKSPDVKKRALDLENAMTQESERAEQTPIAAG